MTTTTMTKEQLVSAIEKEIVEAICNDFSSIMDSVVEAITYSYDVTEDEVRDIVSGDFHISANYMNN